MGFTNSQILAAVLSKWAQPFVGQIASGKIVTSLPFLSNLESKIKASGWVSQSWNIGSEMQPLLGGLSDKVLTPIIHNYVKSLPEDAIPQMAHSFVDNAIAGGGIDVLEGKISFDANDLAKLKALLDKNLPVKTEPMYDVQE